MKITWNSAGAQSCKWNSLATILTQKVASEIHLQLGWRTKLQVKFTCNLFDAQSCKWNSLATCSTHKVASEFHFQLAVSKKLQVKFACKLLRWAVRRCILRAYIFKRNYLHVNFSCKVFVKYVVDAIHLRVISWQQVSSAFQLQRLCVPHCTCISLATSHLNPLL